MFKIREKLLTILGVDYCPKCDVFYGSSTVPQHTIACPSCRKSALLSALLCGVSLERKFKRIDE
jgi:hypothetical protein